MVPPARMTARASRTMGANARAGFSNRKRNHEFAAGRPAPSVPPERRARANGRQCDGRSGGVPCPSARTRLEVHNDAAVATVTVGQCVQKALDRKHGRARAGVDTDDSGVYGEGSNTRTYWSLWGEGGGWWDGAYGHGSGSAKRAHVPLRSVGSWYTRPALRSVDSTNFSSCTSPSHSQPKQHHGKRAHM